MKNTELQFNLQYFAEGAPAGDGGDGAAATGVNTAAAGQTGRTLEELGVPKQKAEKYRARKSKANFTAAPAAAESTELDGQAASAEATVQEQTSKPSWDEVMKDDDYNREMQKTVNQRLEAYKKRNGDAAAGLEALTDMLGIIGNKYGIDVSDLSKVDFAALNKAFIEDTSHYREKAAELGTDVKTAMRMDQLERAEAKRQKQEQDSIRDQRAREHFDQLQRESAELKRLFPNFDLETEMQNKTFVRLTAPGSGLNLEQAYRALHYKEIAKAEAEAVARNTAQAVTNSIQSGQRPRENGSGGGASAPVGTKLYSQMSRAEQIAFKEQIKYNAAHGRKTPLRG